VTVRCYRQRMKITGSDCFTDNSNCCNSGKYSPGLRLRLCSAFSTSIASSGMIMAAAATRLMLSRQGDDQHRDLFNVERGPTEHGAAGLHCGACHQSANNPASGVPGAAQDEALNRADVALEPARAGAVGPAVRCSAMALRLGPPGRSPVIKMYFNRFCRRQRLLVHIDKWNNHMVAFSRGWTHFGLSGLGDALPNLRDALPKRCNIDSHQIFRCQ
jgi:hypothetical protein